MSDNWIVQNLIRALNVWNEKMAEIWTLITQSPENFKGGDIWRVMTDIHGGLQAVAYALLVLFFVIGVMKTCGSFAELHRDGDAVVANRCARGGVPNVNAINRVVFSDFCQSGRSFADGVAFVNPCIRVVDVHLNAHQNLVVIANRHGYSTFK